jgi:hypothetical protein
MLSLPGRESARYAILRAVRGSAGSHMPFVWFSEPAWEQILWAVCSVAGEGCAVTVLGTRRLHAEAPRR